MANIRNSISMQDRMTPVFRSIIKSMDSTLKVMRQLDQQSNKGVQSKAYRAAERDMKRANNELIKMQNNLSRCDKEAQNLSRSSKGVSFEGAGKGLSAFLTGLSSALYLAKNIGSALSNVMETPDALNAASYRLATYDTTKATGSQLMDAVYKTAQASRSDIQSTADLASRILVSGATNGNGAAAINLAGILNKASFLGGSSSEESKRALLQLSQGLASGALQGDELRAIREQAPGLTDTLARGLSSMAEKGMLPKKFLNTTMGDLKELGSQGELTSGRIIAAFKEMEDYVDTTFKDSPKQFGQAVTGILNVWKRWLNLMSKGDNALAKINNKAWELLEWFESPAGEEFFEGLANGVNFVVDCILGLIDVVADSIGWLASLENGTDILTAAFVTLGAVLAGSALISLVNFIAQWWKLLLVAGIIGLIVYALLQVGATIGDIVGFIAGVIIWIITYVAYAGMAIWDIITSIASVIVYIIGGIVIALIWGVQFGVQLIIWAVMAIGIILKTLWNVVCTVFMAIWGSIKWVVGGIYDEWVTMTNGIISLLADLASVIDAIFGSNLHDTVVGWMDGLSKSVGEFDAFLNVEGTFTNIGDMWADSYSEVGDMFAGKGEYDDLNLFDNMDAVGRGVNGFTSGIQDWLTGISAYGEDGSNYRAVTNWAYDSTNKAFKFGDDLDKTLEDFSMKMEEFGDFMGGGMDISGGNLDSIGSIGSDVDISDEDIQLLRDVAARDFLLTLQTSTPQVNNNFGDIKETADVNKILEVIQDMVDEQLAVSLVVE